MTRTWLCGHGCFLDLTRKEKIVMPALLNSNPRRMPYDPAARGYHAVYRRNETNHCPGCGRSNWVVGRVSAECGFCSTALPFAGTEFAAERFTLS
jgi:hypothetical protein